MKLLHRTTRRIKMTPQGELLYARASPLVRRVRETEAEIRRLDGVPRGRLRVSMPSGTHAPILAGWMAEFLRAYPEVQLELVGSSVHVDLVAEGYDVAIRRGKVEDASLICRNLFFDDDIAVATPEYLARAGQPQVTVRSCRARLHCGPPYAGRSRASVAVVRGRVGGGIGCVVYQ